MATLTDLSVSDSNYIIVTWDDENAYAYYLGLGHRASSTLTIPFVCSHEFHKHVVFKSN